MDAVRVQYTVKPEYVETNKRNIARVMSDLRDLDRSDVKYSAFLLDDGKTFLHFVIRASEDAAQALSNLEAFQEFQRQLRESEPESPPQAENLELVGANWDLF